MRDAILTPHALEQFQAHPLTPEQFEAEKARIIDEPAHLKRLERIKKLPRSFSVKELLETTFAPVVWIIINLLTTGLTILAGAPKLGKSWLMLSIAVAVGIGGSVLGRYQVEARKVLCLFLEDTPKRLKNRLEKIAAKLTENVIIFNQWRSGAEGIADLDAYLGENSDIRLVIIDTLARFRGASRGDDRYSEDYATSAAIKEIADRHDLAIVAVHHVRKMGADDVMDTVSGTNGLNGGADATWILSRARGEADATLFVTGRDIEEQKLALRFDPAMATWTVIGDAQEYAQSEERRQVLEALPLASAMKTSEIAAAIGKKVQATDYLLKQLEGDGLVKKPKYGYWTRTGVESTVTPVTVTSNISKVQGIQAVKDLQGIQYLQGVIQEATPKPAQEPPSLDYGIDNEPSGASGESPEYCEVSIDETF